MPSLHVRFETITGKLWEIFLPRGHLKKLQTPRNQLGILGRILTAKIFGPRQDLAQTPLSRPKSGLDLAEVPKSRRPKSRRGLPVITAAKISTRSLNLSGFLKNHSCCTAILKMTKDWRRSLVNRESAMAVAVDLSKAFDFIKEFFFF